MKLRNVAKSLAAAMPDDPALQEELFDLLREQDREVRADRWTPQVMNLAKTLSDNADANYAFGDLYLNIGDFDKARMHYANVLKNDPKNLNALVLSG